MGNKQELKTAIRQMIATGEKRAKLVEERGTKMDKDTQWLINNNINSQIAALRAETDKSVGHLAALTEEARKEMKKEMLYAIETAADDAALELKKAIKDGEKKMIAFEKKAAATHAASALARKELAKSIEDNAAEVSNMLKDAVAADARAQTLMQQETQEAIKKTNTKISAYSDQMAAQAKKARASIKALTSKTISAIKTQEQEAALAVEKFSSEDAARQKSALEFLAKQMAIAQKESEEKFGKAYARLAANRKEADEMLSGAVTLLNDALAKQAALADSRFEKTVKDISSARKQAAEEVATLRKNFATGMLGVDALVRNVEQNIVGQIGVVSGEVISMKANQARVNKRVKDELARVESLSNKRFSDSKKARGKLKMLMDENKQAAAQEVKALKDDLMVKLDKLNKERSDNSKEMAKDLTSATEKFYEAAATMQRKHQGEIKQLNGETAAAALADKNALDRAKEKFDSKIIMLTKTQTKSMQLELQKKLTRAIQIGEAKAKAVEERIAEHLKKTQEYLMVELAEGTDRAADDVFKLLTGKRQKIADNYLSLKAYAVSAADKIADYVGQGKGRGLSSIGDMLQTVAAIGAVKAPKAEGTGFGSSKLVEIFSGKSMKVPNAVAKINGLVNEFTSSAKQVRERWPMGLGKYLLDKLEESMMGKGVLQVDKVDGKAGNYVFLNGHSVGLSNKLSDFAALAARMTTYEDVLAKLTSKLTVGPHNSAKTFAKPPEWEGN